MTEVTNAQVEADPGDFATLILGIGNILWADEGFGVRAVEALHQRFSFSPDVCVMDGGTQGIFLLPWVRGAFLFSMRSISDCRQPRYSSFAAKTYRATWAQKK